jgi:hypothetical protein
MIRDSDNVLSHPIQILLGDVPPIEINGGKYKTITSKSDKKVKMIKSKNDKK